MIDERIKKIEMAMENKDFEEKVANVQSEKEHIMPVSTKAGIHIFRYWKIL